MPKTVKHKSAVTKADTRRMARTLKTIRAARTKYPVGTVLPVKTGLTEPRGVDPYKETQQTSRARWKRVLDLRRALIPYILLAGERAPVKGEAGPQKFVCLSDDFDDVLYTALDREAREK